MDPVDRKGMVEGIRDLSHAIVTHAVHVTDVTAAFPDPARTLVFEERPVHVLARGETVLLRLCDHVFHVEVLSPLRLEGGHEILRVAAPERDLLRRLAARTERDAGMSTAMLILVPMAMMAVMALAGLSGKSWMGGFMMAFAILGFSVAVLHVQTHATRRLRRLARMAMGLPGISERATS